jgi:hypothetical protein
MRNMESELVAKVTMVLKRAIRENNPDWTDNMTNKLIERATSLLISKDPSCDRYGIVSHDAVIKLNSSSLEDITNWTSEQIVDFVDPIFMKALTLLAYEASYVSAIQPVIESAQPVVDQLAPYNSMIYGISTGLSAAIVFFGIEKTVRDSAWRRKAFWY